MLIMTIIRLFATKSIPHFAQAMWNKKQKKNNVIENFKSSSTWMLCHDFTLRLK